MSIKKGVVACLAMLMLAPFMTGCGDIQKALQGEQKTWKGTWSVTSVTLDGASQPVYNAVWTLNDNDWTLVTIICQASGPLSSDGNNLSLTVSSTTCPETLPAPVGRTATGNADVNGDSMNFTLSHELNGVTHTLVSVCSRT